MKIIDGLLGKVKLAVVVDNVHVFLHDIAEKINIYDVEVVNNKKIFFSIDYYKARKVVAYLNEICYNVYIISTYGFLPMLVSLRKRIGLIVGLIVLLAGIIVFPMFVWNVEVVEVKNKDVSQVYDFLQECNVKRGASIFDIDLKELEKKLYLNFENMSFVSCEKIGVKIKVSVLFAIDENVVSKNNGDVVACRSGVVSRIVVYSGTPLVKKGDVVKSGDVLIGAYITNSSGEKVECLADGEIFVSIQIWHNEDIPLNKNTTKRTGESYTSKELVFKGIKLKIKNKYEPYEKFETSVKRYYIANNNFLPFEIVETIYYKLEVVEEKVDYEKNKNALQEFAFYKACEKINGEYVLINKYMQEELSENSVIIKVFLDIEMQAC